MVGDENTDYISDRLTHKNQMYKHHATNCSLWTSLYHHAVLQTNTGRNAFFTATEDFGLM
jgi:hypothetical protein